MSKYRCGYSSGRNQVCQVDEHCRVDSGGIVCLPFWQFRYGLVKAIESGVMMPGADPV